MKRILLSAVLAAVLALPGAALAEGNLAADAERLADMNINSEELTFSVTEYQLEPENTTAGGSFTTAPRSWRSLRQNCSGTRGSTR